MTYRRAADVEWKPAGPEHFTGEVWFGPLHTPLDPADLNVLGVRFSPGARSDWHSHPAGQVLYVVEGTARVQAEGEPMVVAGPGDAVHAPAGVVHWHGATPDGPMTHLSITHGGATAWLARKVTDTEYGGTGAP
jgi:quercetin dioxygenase-like cupin family protein